ncbi:zf-HC2 domain-containing protein [Kitasatospora sp. NPDC058170]|uniref:zf-HC2 domain-containing protein n=1 Tax=Kitasatospora sp. NPDC058170 TaxID=3346364 RepID=UPI0036DBA50E
MRCAHFRTALSSRLDGEPAGVPDRRLDKHVERCPACRDWLERAERLRGLRPAAPADGPSADWSAGLLARLGEEGLGEEQLGGEQLGREDAREGGAVRGTAGGAAGGPGGTPGDRPGSGGPER